MSITALSRPPVYARRGIVCSNSPLAASAGIRVLQEGGNAFDAALAVAALWTHGEVSVEGFMPIRIKHRDKNSASTQQPEMSLVLAESALLSKVS